MSQITCFVKHDSRGFDIAESVPLEEYHSRFPIPLSIESISWIDSKNKSHTMDTRDLFVRVLPDRSGLLCLENPMGKHKRFKYPARAFVINEDESLRYELMVPVEMTNRLISPLGKHYFGWVETKDNEGKYGLTASIEGAGQFYFELDYHTGKFLWGKEIRF
jgi:hypothetical protein